MIQTGSLRFRNLKPADLAAIMSIENKSYDNPWSPDSFEQVLRDPKTFTVLGTCNAKGSLIGYIVFSEVADELHILNVAIDPKFRRMGIATFMLMHVHQGAIQRGRKQSYLEVRASNKGAMKMYEKFGYARIGLRKDYYVNNHEDAVVMVSELK